MPPITIEDNANNVRVVLGDISAAGDDSDFGLKVISSDGSTVIIDGTSTMFKIQATGTVTVAWPAGAPGGTLNSAVVSTASYSAPTIPAFLVIVSGDITNVTASRYNGIETSVLGTAWATSAQGFMQPDAGGLQVTAWVNLRVHGAVTPGVGVTGGIRYYIFLEAAI